jgi:L-lactate dehydrogenase complex protein LldG
MLERIRAANRLAAAPDVEVTRDYRRVGGHPPGDPLLLDRFTQRVVDYRAAVHRCAPADVEATLAELCHGWSVAMPAGSPFTVTGAIHDMPTMSPARLDQIDAVITGCAAACAETGTIALDAGPDQGRRALTLLPDRHICVVRADQVVQTVPELLARLDPTRPLTFISGPSATSDIELQRVEGVHGPRTLIVVLAVPS